MLPREPARREGIHRPPVTSANRFRYVRIPPLGEEFLRTALVAVVAVVLASPARAQQAIDSAPPRWGLIGGLNGLTVQFGNPGGGAAGVGSRGWGLSFDFAATLQGILIGGADLGAAWVGDDSSFTQSTTGGQKKSSTAAFFASVYGGVRTPAFPLSEDKVMRSVVGVTFGASSWSGVRSIDSCVDCRSDKLDIDGGSYVEPFVLIGKRNTEDRLVGLKVSYRAYQSKSATVNNVIFIGVAGIRGR
jgi:hypothetical protein